MCVDDCRRRRTHGLDALLLAQAVYLRWTVLRLPEPRGSRNGVAGHGPLLRVLILGDSSAAGVGVDHQDEALLGQLTDRLSSYATVDYKLLAVTGARTGDVLGWVDQLPSVPFDVVVVALGVNDVTKGVSLRKWLRQTASLLDRLVTDFDARYVFVSGLPPMRDFPLLPQPLRWVLGRQADRFDRALHAMVETRDDATRITIDMRLNEGNMSADGFHPGADVYAAWADEVAAGILERPALLDVARSNA